MHYDPIKRVLGNVFNRSSNLRIVFYKLLGLLLLRSWHIQKEIKRWALKIPDNATILDAGAGFGQYSYFLSEINPKWNILAVDVKEEQVCDCNTFFRTIKKDNVLFKIEDLTTFQKPGSFDLILSVDVMEHILEDVLVFKNFHASLKEGGMLLISTPSDQGGSDVSEDGESSFIEEHVRDGYNIGEIEQKLKSVGFTRVSARYSYGNPGKISWKLSMKYPIQMLGISKLFFIVLPFYYFVTFPVAYLLNYMDTNMIHKTGTGLIVRAWK
ncbi:MAG: class I SAM-dependent methyltransferase [Bacteroidetes bacterium]|nr:class I SAM-dependent methyltransferase [Bacteroidota bacterium]HET6242968.1 class I SAM-dependent methyltransferase [Bacteroidia bacterium]